MNALIGTFQKRLTNVTTGIETVLINTSVQWCFDSIFCYNIDTIWERDIVLSISASLPDLGSHVIWFKLSKFCHYLTDLTVNIQVSLVFISARPHRMPKTVFT